MLAWKKGNIDEKVILCCFFLTCVMTMEGEFGVHCDPWVFLVGLNRESMESNLTHDAFQITRFWKRGTIF